MTGSVRKFWATVSDNFVGETNSVRPSRLDWILRQFLQDNSVRPARLDWLLRQFFENNSARLPDLSIFRENFGIPDKYFLKKFQIIQLDCFDNQTIRIHLNKLRALTNAIANAGFRVR